MKDMFRKFAFVGILNFGLVAFAEEEKTEAQPAPEESIQVVCPVSTEENCENCEPASEPAQPVAGDSENK